MSEKQQRLVYSIIEFLNQSIDDGTVKADDKESLEVAIQCIGEAFNVDPSNKGQADKLSVKPATLQSIFDVFIKTRDKVASNAQPTTSSPKSVSAEHRAQADKLKQSGNALMSSKKYDEAIDAYTQAIALDPKNPGDHLSAIGDAEQAISVDPKFVKAYHRLGHAQYSLSDFEASASTFERGLKLEPTNAGLKSGLQNAQARLTADEDSTATATPPPAPGLGSMADMLRGMGGTSGGMPDIASMMNNPQLMAMAQQLAGNGGLANLMQNPAVANMMNQVQSGNMPSMEDIMSDPSLREL
ncbi:hypothetical protein K443DRAFT_91187 [Laccaria amethystina LaAM-08-1]|uniref:SGTA homodimerisation domain-containing protein n=1 Tax=Laccaria amethystina LaAM-08-1 TaxID=1095629 RepID=A0A0C9YBS7_9AGAR|nr:hypothetical protein K443DRAFT_91187 [Laccaria amethystina LaAM-08-1]